MVASGRHCPFLNREDPRCAGHFGVNRLQHAFDHCAGHYDQCPTYRTLLHERHRMRGEIDISDGTTLRLAGQVTVTVPLMLRGRNVVPSIVGHLPTRITPIDAGQGSSAPLGAA